VPIFLVDRISLVIYHIDKNYLSLLYFQFSFTASYLLILLTKCNISEVYLFIFEIFTAADLCSYR